MSVEKMLLLEVLERYAETGDDSLLGDLNEANLVDDYIPNLEGVL